MEKMVFDFQLNKEQEEAKRKRFASLKQNKQMQSWLERNHQEESFLYEHSVKMNALAKRYATCVGCSGLHECVYEKKGYVLDLVYDGMLVEKLTPCRYQRNEMEALKHQNNYVLCDLSPAQLKIDLSKLDITKESKEYQVMMKEIILKLQSLEKGMYLYGKPGVGKTYIAAGIANYFAKKKKKVAFVNTVKLISDLKALFGDHEGMEKRLRQLSAVDVLVLDDIGGENMTKWSRDEILLSILNERMEKELLTYFTSNYSFEELAKQYETLSGLKEPMNALRFLERVKALSFEIFVKGESRR